jgi:hypothetical protein
MIQHSIILIAQNGGTAPKLLKTQQLTTGKRVALKEGKEHEHDYGTMGNR